MILKILNKCEYFNILNFNFYKIKKDNKSIK